MSELITPFKLTVADETVADLRSSLAQTRWPDRETVSDWSQGAPLDQVKALCDYWPRDYDWRRCEAWLNAVDQFRTIIDGLGIHFRHVRSPNPDAVPLIMTHGWPGSVIEFLNAIGPLTDPAAHGGNASDAFHVVVPSLPGYGFSDKPTTTGWGVESIAAAWVALMKRPCSRPTPSSGPRSFQARRSTPVTPQRITLTRPRPRRRPASAGPGCSNECSISTWTAPSVRGACI
jgi:epoxide hydrolase